ncbi:MAG TPA: MCE family protein [Acidimicrobiales bacterium]|nr:MCE family protein [Acidimicrobiales bacterium]
MNFLRRLPSSAFKFLIFALVCLLLLVGLAVKIGNISLFSHRHSIQAQLVDVTGLATGDSVNIAGVPIGQVTSIGVQHGHALVGMNIDNTVTLHRDTDLGVRWKNVIGQKEIQIFPSAQGPVLAPGSTIPLSHDVSDASVNSFLNTLGPLLTSINPQQANEFVVNVSGALEGDTAQVDQLINSGATISNTVGALDNQVGQVIGNLDLVLTAISSRSGDLGSLVDNLQTVASSLASKNTLLDTVIGNLSQVATDLAGLIGSNHSTITSIIDNLRVVAGDVQGNQQQLASSLSTLGAGLAPYIQISAVGQWFAVQAVYTCLGNQTSCTYYESASPPAGSGPGGSLPAARTQAARSSALSSAARKVATTPVAASGIGSVLQAVSGQAQSPGLPSTGAGS